eukprot:2539056-Rhodomonas_salina.3
MPTLVPSEAIPEHNSYDGSEDAYRDENGMPLSPNWFWYGATDVEKEACASDQQASVPFSQSSFQRPRRIFRRSTDTRGQDVESDPSAAVDSAQFDSKQIRAVVLEVYAISHIRPAAMLTLGGVPGGVPHGANGGEKDSQTPEIEGSFTATHVGVSTSATSWVGSGGRAAA